MTHWTNERPTVNWQRRIAEERAPIACLNWEAEFVVDAINAEFRHALTHRHAASPHRNPPAAADGGAGEAETEWQPAGTLTTALCLAVIAACSVAGLGIISWLIKSIGGR